MKKLRRTQIIPFCFVFLIISSVLFPFFILEQIDDVIFFVKDWYHGNLHRDESSEEETFLKNKKPKLPLSQFCAHPKNCYSSKCYSKISNDRKNLKGGCFPSPYESSLIEAERKRKNLTFAHELEKVGEKFIDLNPTLPKTSGGFKRREFTCPARKDERDEYFRLSVAENSKTDPLFNFKKHTSFMFNKWYDFGRNDKCESPFSSSSSSSSSDFSFKGSHHRETDGLYHLENVCFRPKGKMAGFVPSKSELRFDQSNIVDDVWVVQKEYEEGLRDWLRPENLEILSESDLKKRKICFLETKVVLFPITTRIDNPGHSFMRFGSLLRVVESVLNLSSSSSSSKNQDQEQKVTIGYVALEAGKISSETKAGLMKENTFQLFYDSVGTSWFSIYGSPSLWRHGTKLAYRRRKKEEEKIWGFRPDDDDLKENAMACFKDVVIWQNAAVFDAGNAV